MGGRCTNPPFVPGSGRDGSWRGRGARMDTILRYYRIDRNGIALLKFILESYDNAAVMRTVDRKGSIVELSVSPGFMSEVEAVIGELRDELNIREVECPEGLEPL
jgi:hypothetical protein